MRLTSLALLALLLVVSAADAQQKATLLYVTDVHEVAPVVDVLGERGGIARLKTVVDRVRETDPDTKLIFGGDLAGGVLFGAVFRGEPTVEALGRVGVDLGSFGQHDFDFGADHTRKLVAMSSFPWITSNLVEAGTDKPFDGLPRVTVLEANGLRVGCIGLTDAMETSSARGEVQQLPLVRAAADAFDRLNRLGVDAVVAFTQAPLEVNEALMNAIPELDAILSEERNETHSTIWYVGDRPIASPGGNLASVVRLELLLDESGEVETRVSMLPLDENVPQQNSLWLFSDSLMQVLEERLAEPVAYSEVKINSGMYTDARARWGECTAGNLIADAFRDWYHADIGLIQGGGIRASVEAGTVTKKSVLALLPFNNRVVEIELSGAAIRDALEYGVSAVEEKSGRFLQVSGIAYEYSPSQPVGSRITKVTVNGKPLKEKKSYTIALTDYLRKGGEGYTQFAEAKLLTDLPDAPVDAKVLESYLRVLKTNTTHTEGRITRSE